MAVHCRRRGGNPPPPPQSLPRQRQTIRYRGLVATPPPPRTKVTITGDNPIYRRENLIGPFLVHKCLGPRPPPRASPEDAPPSPSPSKAGLYGASIFLGVGSSQGALSTPLPPRECPALPSSPTCPTQCLCLSPTAPALRRSRPSAPPPPPSRAPVPHRSAPRCPVPSARSSVTWTRPRS